MGLMVSCFRWRLVGDTDEYGEPAHKLDDYQIAAESFGIEIFCPGCLRWVKTRFTSKDHVMGRKRGIDIGAMGELYEREQFLTGLCSQVCWYNYFGLTA